MTSYLYSTPTNETTLLGTELNSLQGGKLKNGSTVLDNTTNRHKKAIAELYLGANTNFSADNFPAVQLYLIPSYDGTNYADDGNTTKNEAPEGYLVGLFQFNAEVSARRAVIEHINLAPIKYTGTIYANFSAGIVLGTGNTIKIKTYGVETA